MSAKSDERLRVAVIGLGFGQQVHVPAFRCDPRCEVTMVCASSEAKAAEIATRLDVPHSSGDWRRVVADPEIDAVSIAVPPRLQPEIAIAALEHGKAVFCEKPLAAHPHEALAAQNAARRSRLANMVNFEFCECDAWKQARINLGTNVSSVKVDWRVQTYANRNRLDNWKSRPEEGGGTLQAFVAHTFHTLESFMGPICRLKALLSKAEDDPRPGETEVDLEADFLTGGRATVHVETDAPPPHHHRIEFAGASGKLTLLNAGTDYIKGFHVLYDGIGADREATVSPQDPTFTKTVLQSGSVSWKEAAALAKRDGRVEATSRLVQKFVDWTLGGPPARPDFDDGCRVQFLVDIARRSSIEGRWMDTLV